jgi:hypothetical protein
VTLTPALYTNDNTFYNAQIVIQGSSLVAPFFENVNEFYEPIVQAAALIVSPPYFENANTFYGGQINLNITFPDWVEPGWVEPGWVEWPYFNQNQFFGATVVGSATELTQDARFDNTQSFYSPRVRFLADIPNQILQLLTNRQELNPTTGTFTVYDDDGVTPLWVANAWADAAGTIPYSGKTLNRIDRLELL